MYTHFRPRIRSRHPSHRPLRARNNMPLMQFKSIIRLGSTTDMEDTVTNGGNRLELNTIAAIKNSSNKLKMKQCFTDDNVKTADWFTFAGPSDEGIGFYKNNIRDNQENDVFIENLPFPIISKSLNGSRGRGNIKHDTIEQLEEWIETKTPEQLRNYIFEKFYNYAREYRLHVTKNGCFYTCRKMLKRTTPDADKWYRNDDHCVWIMESNELFDRPTNWDNIVEESVKALNAVGLDFGAVDLRIQSATNKDGNKREEPEFIVVEINSAPSFGEETTKHYLTELPKLLLEKYKN